MGVLVSALERPGIRFGFGGAGGWVCILAFGVSIICTGIIEHMVSFTDVYLWNAKY
jgi:hypothetical protein